MAQNLISGKLTEENITQIKNTFASIKTIIPFLKPLADKDKKGLIRLGDYYEPLVKDGCNITEQYPSIFPGTFNAAEYKSDYELYCVLKPIVAIGKEILSAIEDTMIAAGSDALMATFEVYGYVQSNIGEIAGLQETAGRMAEYFPRKSKKENKETPAQ